MPVNNKIKINFGKRLSIWGFVVAILVCSETSFALPMIPMAFNGSLGYTYSYIKSDQAESETSSITANVSGAGFVWQPWFITLGVGLSVGFAESNSNTGSGGTSTSTYSGNIQFTVFPQSRFPFVMSLSRTDSQLENTGAVFNTDDHYVNYRIFMSQTYYGATGYVARLSYDHNAFESDRSDSSSDSVSASFRARESRHRYSVNANYTTSERSNSSLKPNTELLEFRHNYSSGPDMGVSSLASYTRNDSGVGGGIGVFQNAQANSTFSWRPIDRPYTLSGGARVSTSDSGSGIQTNSLAANIGSSVRVTRSLRVLALASISATDSDTVQTVNSTQSISGNYSSQQYFVGSFSWNWNGSAGFNNSFTSIDDESKSIQNLATSLGQTLNRSWSIGRTSTMNLAFSQSGSASKSTDVDEPIYGLGHGMSLGWSRSGLSSSTFFSVSMSDTRTFGETDTSFQQLTAQLTQRQAVSRVSAISANVTFQASQQDIPEIDSPSQPKTLAANLTYTNARTFGIYPLRFSAKLTYNKRFADQEVSGYETLQSENRFDYRIGLLTTNAVFRIITTQGGATSESLTFSITRSF